mmetsp:Transcript_63389/g.182479  ORF Transcript_63389/g.182479 Transcript_63389/m.182479 type:complete len:248 (+) Transcript_63389:718-1461(+)
MRGPHCLYDSTPELRRHFGRHLPVDALECKLHGTTALRLERQPPGDARLPQQGDGLVPGVGVAAQPLSYVRGQARVRREGRRGRRSALSNHACALRGGIVRHVWQMHLKSSLPSPPPGGSAARSPFVAAARWDGLHRIASGRCRAALATSRRRFCATVRARGRLAVHADGGGPRRRGARYQWQHGGVLATMPLERRQGPHALRPSRHLGPDVGLHIRRQLRQRRRRHRLRRHGAIGHGDEDDVRLAA